MGRRVKGLRAERRKRTSNAQDPTLNVQVKTQIRGGIQKNMGNMGRMGIMDYVDSVNAEKSTSNDLDCGRVL